MRRPIFRLALCSAVLVGACDRGSRGVADGSRAETGYHGSTVWERQRDTEGVAAGRQPENATDQELTSSVREAILADDSISRVGRDVNVVTLAGVVTLRGRVDSLQEKQAIVEIARGTSGVKRVNDQIGVVLR